MIEVDDNPDFTSTVFGMTRPPSTSFTHSVPLAYGKYYWRMMVYTPAGDWGAIHPGEPVHGDAAAASGTGAALTRERDVRRMIQPRC